VYFSKFIVYPFGAGRRPEATPASPYNRIAAISRLVGDVGAPWRVRKGKTRTQGPKN
jgi:hypothetical protein